MKELMMTDLGIWFVIGSLLFCIICLSLRIDRLEKWKAEMEKFSGNGPIVGGK